MSTYDDRKDAEERKRLFLVGRLDGVTSIERRH